MIETEVLPSPVELADKIRKNEGWNPVYRRSLEELFRSTAFMCALNEILVQSDETLKNVGMTDFTSEIAIKNALRAQGVAQGLTQAVELICSLACEPEEKKDEV